MVQRWPHAVDLDIPGRGLGLDGSARLQAWLVGRDWRRGSGAGPTAARYRFVSQADAEAFAAKFGGRRSV